MPLASEECIDARSSTRIFDMSSAGKGYKVEARDCTFLVCAVMLERAVKEVSLWRSSRTTDQ